MRKQIPFLYLLLFFISTPFLQAQELSGPEIVKPGTLAVYKIVPQREAAWTVTPTKNSSDVYSIDSSAGAMYFATPQEGIFTIVVAVVIDGKPVQITKTLINGKGDEVKPFPPPGPEPNPSPNFSLADWIKMQTSVLVKSKNIEAEKVLIARCFEQIVQQINSGNIRTAQNARTQVQICLTAGLAQASPTAILDWQVYLTELSQKMASELGNNINNVNEVRRIFQTVAKCLLGESSVQSEPDECSRCIQTPVQPIRRWR